MSYRFFEVDLTFTQPTGATMPITAESEEEARRIATELFSDYENLSVAAVRDMGTPGPKATVEEQQGFDAAEPTEPLLVN